jgi:hypothetical protein
MSVEHFIGLRAACGSFNNLDWVLRCGCKFPLREYSFLAVRRSSPETSTREIEIGIKTSILIMQVSCKISSSKAYLGTLVLFGLAVLAPSLWAQQNKAASDSALAAWSNIEQLVKYMETAVQSKNLHGIHDPTIKIRAPIKTLKQHSSMYLAGEKGQKIGAALKHLDSAITDLHSAADEGNQGKSETALKGVQTALDQLKALDPEVAFKYM